MYRKNFKQILENYQNNIKDYNPRFFDGKIIKKKIEIHNPYHHNFEYNLNFERTNKKIFFELFDILRVFGALFIAIKIGMKFPSYVFFRRNKESYENNPDFMLCNQLEFQRLNI
jgi:hypothetical protein